MHVVLAKKHGSRRLQSAHDLGVFGWNAVFEHAARGGGSYAGGVEEVLERNWNSVKRPAPATSLNLGLRISRTGQRRLRGHGNERVQRGIDAVNSLEACLREIDGRHPLPTDLVRSLLEAQRREVVRRNPASG